MKIVVACGPIERLDMPVLDELGGDEHGNGLDRHDISDINRGHTSN